MAQIQAQRYTAQKQKQKGKQVQIPSTETIAEQQTAQSQVLEQQQSFEVVQTLLTVSFASIFYLRDLLPDKCFENRNYSSIRHDRHWSYEDFLNGNIPGEISNAERKGANEKPEGTENSQGKVMIIAKGKTAAADKVLSWLLGIFDALRRSYLAGVQISVILDANRPTDVIESYVFRFSYKAGSSRSQPELESMSFESPRNQRVTIKNARACLHSFSRGLNNLVQNLPFLPDKRFMTVHLNYTDACPFSYDPPGFFPERNSSMMVPDTELWQMSEANAGKMNAGFYDANLTIRHLVPIHLAGLQPEDDLAIPSCLRYLKEVPRFESQTPEDIRTARDSSQNFAEPAFPSVKDATQQLSQLVEEEPELPQLNVHAKCSPSTDTRDTYELRIRRKLDNMLCTSSIPRDGRFTRPWTPFDNSSVLTTWDLKEPHKERLVQKACQTALERVEGAKEKIVCECGSARREGTILACDCCDHWKHQHCYGLEASTLPEVFICYCCLTENLEGLLYLDLMGLAKQRRTLWIMRDKGMPSSLVTLGKMLNCSSKKAGAVVKQLRTKGLLKVTSIPSSQGQSPTLSQYSIDEDVLRVAFEPDGVFHPFAMLSQFYVQVSMKVAAQRSSGTSHDQEQGQPKTIAELATMIDEHIDDSQSVRASDTTDGDTDELRAYEPASLGVLHQFLQSGSASQPEAPSDSNPKKRPHSGERVTPRRSKRQMLSTRSLTDFSWQE